MARRPRRLVTVAGDQGRMTGGHVERRVASSPVLRRSTFAVLLTMLVVAACGGGDDASSATTARASTTTPTNVVVPDGSDACEDAPDPADYRAAVPTVRRPCEIPTELTSTVVEAGTGPAAEVGAGVIYHATLVQADDGTLIGSSWTTGQPSNSPAVGSNPEAGPLDDALIGARAGEILRLDVPAGTPGAAAALPISGVTVPADTPLTYVLQVLAVVPVIGPADRPDVDIEPSVDATDVTVDDVVVGDGKVVEEGDTVLVAMLMLRGDNEVVLFDSWHQRQPLVIPLRPELLGRPEPATLPGVFEGLQGARVGGLRVITMPPEMAFGEGGRPLLGLPPDTDVIVVADIVGAF